MNIPDSVIIAILEDEQKIRKIRFRKLIGKIIFCMILVTLLILIFMTLNSILITQYDMMNTQNQVMVEIDDLKHPDAISEAPQPVLQDLGKFKITYHCNEKYPHICNDGSGRTDLIPYHTVATDPKVIPIGSTIVINGKEYVAAEIGGTMVKGKHIDMLVEKHQEALDLGVDYEEVYLKIS